MSVSIVGKQITDGLIFVYDRYNAKSFIGAPTTNQQWNGGSEVTPWTVGGTNTDVTNTVDQGPVKGAKTWKFIKTGTSNQWNGWEANYSGIWTGNSGDVWTTSYWYRTTAPANVTNFGIGSFFLPDWSRAYNSTILANVSSIIADGEWRFNYTTTQINENYSNAIIVDGPSWGYSTAAGVLYINGLQWEKKAYASPFAYGARTMSQGFIDLGSRATIDGNMTYSSLANPYFNGPTSFDYMYATETHSHKPGNSFTYEIWFKYNSDTGYDKIMVGKPGGHIGLMTWNGSQYFRLRSGAGFHDIGVAGSAGAWCHLVGTYTAGVGSSMYKNGSLIQTISFSNALLDYGNVLHMGGNVGWNSNYSINGELPLIRVYNRVLSYDEVLKNYNASKGRFGL